MRRRGEEEGTRGELLQAFPLHTQCWTLIWKKKILEYISLFCFISLFLFFTFICSISANCSFFSCSFPPGFLLLLLLHTRSSFKASFQLIFLFFFSHSFSPEPAPFLLVLAFSLHIILFSFPFSPTLVLLFYFSPTRFLFFLFYSYQVSPFLLLLKCSPFLPPLPLFSSSCRFPLPLT